MKKTNYTKNILNTTYRALNKPGKVMEKEL